VAHSTRGGIRGIRPAGKRHDHRRELLRGLFVDDQIVDTEHLETFIGIPGTPIVS
jgi:hypothetical protein